ncbi:EAL domain-containing protein [Legionella geestiana]|uniref:EAL domain-containing protein n=1 Tax=Legionella geestiana TaxID=45065 RepID=UPI0010925CCE|nr:EAL domain-containing protein [Legionella geestiana]QDQ40140.1 EAL domain-containing protein [Legionella geestiana]
MVILFSSYNRRIALKNTFFSSKNPRLYHYSSYAYLRQFKPDRIKIDKSFIDGLPFDIENAAIVKSIIALCHILGMKVTAEGVETREQAQFLMQEGCDEAQGYYFSKPLQLYELRALIKSGGEFKLPE